MVEPKCHLSFACPINYTKCPYVHVCVYVCVCPYNCAAAALTAQILAFSLVCLRPNALIMCCRTSYCCCCWCCCCFSSHMRMLVVVVVVWKASTKQLRQPPQQAANATKALPLYTPQCHSGSSVQRLSHQCEVELQVRQAAGGKL